jgi:branched-chain amino acid transport system substrate-binding protein
MNDETRAWSKRFFEQTKRMPTQLQAANYSAAMHYLKAVKAAGTDETVAVMKKMREIPINDFFAKNGRIREDGRMIHDMYVARVKKPGEIEIPVGLLRDKSDYSRRGSIPAARQERLSASGKVGRSCIV